MKKPQKQDFTRINEQIRFSPVRVIDDKGNQVGVIPVDQAKNLARQAGLDLVEVSPNARPPVCRIMDYGKFKYKQQIKKKEKKQKSKVVEVKQLKLRPKIAEHDLQVKIKAAEKFLSQGKKVQLTLQYKGRDLNHTEEGFKVINQIIEQLKDICKVEIKPKVEGNRLNCRLEPL